MNSGGMGLGSARAGLFATVRISLLLLLLLGACGAALWLAWPSSPSSAYPSPDARDIPLYGVNLIWEQYDDATLAAMLDRLAVWKAGCWIRLRFPWAELEPAPGEFQWTEADRIIHALQGRNMRIIAVLETSPAWARHEVDAGFRYAPPRERRAFGAFVAAFVQRYGAAIDAYQIWDEPNIHPHWGNRFVDPAGYVALLREGAIQVRSGDPTAWVLAGGLAPTTEPGGLNQNDIEYLRAMYRAGAAEWFDVLAAKPYGLRSPPDEPSNPNALNFQRVALLRQVMVEAGDEDTPIWGVEFGWNSLPADWAGAPSPWGTTQNEYQQVAWTDAAIEWARREWPWMGPLLWAEWQPASSPDDPRWGFAMLDSKGQPRAILSLFESLPTAPSIAGLGTHGFGEPSVALEGKWRVGDAGADIGEDGSAMSIRFAGTALDVTVRRGNYWAYLVITVDGKPANRLPKDEHGQSYLVLYDPSLRPATVTVASGLPDGEHIARVEAHGGWDQWALASFTVRRESASVGRSVGLALAALAGAGALFGLIRMGAGGQMVLAGRWSTQRWHMARDWWCERPIALRMIALLVAGACFLVVPWSPLSLLGLLGIAGLLLLWPAGGLALTAIAIPFFVRPPVIYSFSLPGVELIIWLTAIGWLVGTPNRFEAWRRFRPHEIDVGAGLLLVAATLSTLLARNTGAASYEWRTVFFSPVLFYALWRWMPKTDEETAWVMGCVDALVAGGVIVALIGIGQRLLSVNLITAEGVARIRALYGSPNNLSLYLERIIPISLSMALFGREQRRRWTYALACIPLILALYWTYSRGAWLVGLPAALLAIGLVRGGTWRWATLGIVVLLSVALIPLAGTQRLESLFDFREGTAFLRLKLWQGAWNMALDHPWAGVGPDNFLYEYRTRYVLPSAWEELNLSHPHNLFLDTWTRLGVMGLVAMGILLVALLGRLLRLAKQHSAEALFIGLLGSMAASVAHGLIDNSFFLVDLSLVLMMTAGLTARADAREQDYSKRHEAS